MTRSAGADRLLGLLHQAVVPPARPNPLVLAWRWRYETALLVGLPLALVALVKALEPTWAVLVATLVTAVLIGWPGTRRRLIARAWCILTPHRLRAGWAQARIHTRRGRLPTIVRCAPKPYGEQVLVWCPAGVTAEDFRTARQILASACYASAIEVVPHPRYRHLVLLGVIRHQAAPVVPNPAELER
ncbi:MAG TPA: hypothetical protein VFQ77_00450 [Pseudonocardiaceae bacterium]|jgi:hypothetical protein|nr:hypothetical protein [Pseudonocardiaceae bacterium]